MENKANEIETKVVFGQGTEIQTKINSALASLQSKTILDIKIANQSSGAIALIIYKK